MSPREASGADARAPWISASFLNTSIFARLRVMIDDQRIAYDTEEDSAALASVVTRHESAEEISDNELPRRFCGSKKTRWIKSLPHFFYANGFFVTSESCADVF